MSLDGRTPGFGQVDVYDAPDGLRSTAQPPPRAGKPPPQRTWLHGVLFGATFLSATWAQSMDTLHSPTVWDAIASPLRSPERLASGLVFAVTLMTILLAHEMGHYLVARHYGVDQSLPYFVPAPTSFGTLGAVILMRSQPPDRAVLLRVAVAGPFAGLVLAVPAAAWGLAHSPVVDPGHLSPNDAWYGSSLLFSALEHLFAPSVFYVYHPVALAAWVGMFVTALNLIPAAQLDGGHVAYALFGKRQRRLSRAVVVMLVVIGVMLGAAERGTVWLVWAGLLTLIGLGHPPVRDETVPLSRGERWAGWAALLVFVLTFIPVPVERVADALDLPATRGEERTLEGTPKLWQPRGQAPEQPEEFRL